MYANAHLYFATILFYFFKLKKQSHIIVPLDVSVPSFIKISITVLQKCEKSSQCWIYGAQATGI